MSVEREREEERRKNESIKFILTVCHFSCQIVVFFDQKMENHGSLDNARVGDHLKPCGMSVERVREEENLRKMI